MSLQGSSDRPKVQVPSLSVKLEPPIPLLPLKSPLSNSTLPISKEAKSEQEEPIWATARRSLRHVNTEKKKDSDSPPNSHEHQPQKREESNLDTPTKRPFSFGDSNLPPSPSNPQTTLKPQTLPTTKVQSPKTPPVVTSNQQTTLKPQALPNKKVQSPKTPPIVTFMSKLMNESELVNNSYAEDLNFKNDKHSLDRKEIEREITPPENSRLQSEQKFSSPNRQLSPKVKLQSPILNDKLTLEHVSKRSQPVTSFNLPSKKSMSPTEKPKTENKSLELQNRPKPDVSKLDTPQTIEENKYKIKASSILTQDKNQRRELSKEGLTRVNSKPEKEERKPAIPEFPDLPLPIPARPRISPKARELQIKSSFPPEIPVRPGVKKPATQVPVVPNRPVLPSLAKTTPVSREETKKVPLPEHSAIFLNKDVDESSTDDNISYEGIEFATSELELFQSIVEEKLTSSGRKTPPPPPPTESGRLTPPPPPPPSITIHDDNKFPDSSSDDFDISDEEIEEDSSEDEFINNDSHKSTFVRQATDSGMKLNTKLRSNTFPSSSNIVDFDTEATLTKQPPVLPPRRPSKLITPTPLPPDPHVNINQPASTLSPEHRAILVDRLGYSPRYVIQLNPLSLETGQEVPPDSTSPRRLIQHIKNAASNFRRKKLSENSLQISHTSFALSLFFTTLRSRFFNLKTKALKNGQVGNRVTSSFLRSSITFNAFRRQASKNINAEKRKARKLTTSLRLRSLQRKNIKFPSVEISDRIASSMLFDGVRGGSSLDLIHNENVKFEIDCKKDQIVKPVDDVGGGIDWSKVSSSDWL